MLIKDGFLLFWNEWPSNWTHSPFTLNKIKYNCVEQFMMAKKAEFFNDTKTYNKIMKASHPREQKALGREVKNYNDNKWSSVRYQIVLEGTLAKYQQNESLKQKLLDTGDLIFVEASPSDTIWGIGMDENHPNATRPQNWKGKNLLGKCITETRSIIRS